MKQMWLVGVVNPDDEHVVLSYGEFEREQTPVALVAAGPGRAYTVQFMLEPGQEDTRGRSMVDEVRGELDFHLVELDEPDPWAYPRYHGATAWNACGSVHWTLHRKNG